MMLWEKNIVTAKHARFNDNFGEITSITEGEFEEFKKLYNECKDDGIFKFKGFDVYKDYAKYLIQYLERGFADNWW